MTTRLDIGDRETGVVVRSGEVHEMRLALLPGTQQLADETFRHEPPRPVELESAIDVVEDQLTAAVGVVPTDSSLVLLGPLARQLSQAVGATDGGSSTVSIETVEGLFQRLASESLGNPAARRGLPAGNVFVAGVLILREFMHHLGFESVTLEAQQLVGLETRQQCRSDLERKPHR
jgi:exopolyphosphatase/pppGpp-phosphohydrolase